VACQLGRRRQGRRVVRAEVPLLGLHTEERPT
jgi:hypothetical protein